MTNTTVSGLEFCRLLAVLALVTCNCSATSNPEPIEVTLPLTPGESCNPDRTLGGVVVGSGDRPVEVVWVWFHRFGVRTDQDRSWKHRGLFEGWWMHRLHRPLSITMPQCDKEIFFTQDRFTEARNWAFELERRFEVPPAGITDIRMRLRASPEQLCREG